ncbi:MAG: hypothetical protein U0457_12600 [Candidatus Sericytochromatia bacterium]
MKLALNTFTVMLLKNDFIIYFNCDTFEVFKAKNNRVFKIAKNCTEDFEKIEPFFIDAENNKLGIISGNNCDIKFFEIKNFTLKNLHLWYSRIIKTDKKYFVSLKYKEKTLYDEIYKNFVQIYDIKTEELLEEIFLNYQLISVSPNEKFGIFTLYNKDTFLYSFKEKKRLIDFNYGQKYLDIAKFSPNGRYIFFVYGYDLNGKGLGIVYDFEKNDFIYNINYHLFTNDFFKISFTKDSKYIILSCTDLFVSIFETETGNILSNNENIHTFLYDEENNKIAYFLKDTDNRMDYEIYIEDFDNFLEREIKLFN